MGLYMALHEFGLLSHSLLVVLSSLALGSQIALTPLCLITVNKRFRKHYHQLAMYRWLPEGYEFMITNLLHYSFPALTTSLYVMLSS